MKQRKHWLRKLIKIVEISGLTTMVTLIPLSYRTLPIQQFSENNTVTPKARISKKNRTIQKNIAVAKPSKTILTSPIIKLSPQGNIHAKLNFQVAEVNNGYKVYYIHSEYIDNFTAEEFLNVDASWEPTEEEIENVRQKCRNDSSIPIKKYDAYMIYPSKYNGPATNIWTDDAYFQNDQYDYAHPRKHCHIAYKREVAFTLKNITPKIEYLNNESAVKAIPGYSAPKDDTINKTMTGIIPFNVNNIPPEKTITLNLTLKCRSPDNLGFNIDNHTFTFSIDKNFTSNSISYKWNQFKHIDDNLQTKRSLTWNDGTPLRRNFEYSDPGYLTFEDEINDQPDTLDLSSTLTLTKSNNQLHYELNVGGTATNQGNENISYYNGEYNFQIDSVNADLGEAYKNNSQIIEILKENFKDLKLRTRFWLSESLSEIKTMFDDKVNKLLNAELSWFKNYSTDQNDCRWISFDPTKWNSDEIKANINDANRTINLSWKYKPLVPEPNVPMDKDGWVTINIKDYKINEDESYYPTYDEIKTFLNNTFNNIHDDSIGTDPFTIEWAPNTKLSDLKNFDEFKREINRMMAKLAHTSGSSKIPSNLFWFTEDFNFPSSSTRVSSSNINEQKHEYNDQLFPLWTEKYDWNLKNQLSNPKNFDDYHATVTLNFHYHPLFPTPNGTGGCKTTDGWNIVPITIQVHENPTVHLQETWKRFTVNSNKLSYDPDKGFSFIPQKPFDPDKNPWSSLIGKPQPKNPGPVKGIDLGIWHLYQTAHVNYFSLDGLGNNEIVTVKVGDQEPTKLDSLDGIYDFELYDPIMELPKKKQPEPTPQKNQKMPMFMKLLFKVETKVTLN